LRNEAQSEVTKADAGREESILGREVEVPGSVTIVGEREDDARLSFEREHPNAQCMCFTR